MLSQHTEAEKMSSKPLDGDKISAEPTKVYDAMQDDDEKCIECDVCKDNSDDQTIQLPTASKRCIECQQNLCSRCITDHRRQRLFKDHHIVDIPCQVGENAAEPNQSKNEATADSIAEQIPCDSHDSANVSSGCLTATHAQYQTSGTDVRVRVMAKIIRERDRLKEYEAEMSSHVGQLRKREDDIKTAAENITEMILKKHSEYLARLERDTKCLLEQLDSIRQTKLLEIGIALKEDQSYLQKITDRRTNLEEILNNRGSVEANDDFTKYLLLHVHFQRPIPSLANVSFHESSSWTYADKNLLGRLEGLTNISKTQMEPSLKSYMKFLRNVHSRSTDARKSHWKVMILNEEAMKNLCDLKILHGVRNELGLSRDHKKWDELQKTHVKIASFLYEVTRPTSESSSEKLERQLTELQRTTGKLWNTIQFHIHYRNSERGLIPEGFQNYENTCYFNSVLQCLLQTVLLPFELTVNIYGLENVLTEKKEVYCLSKAFMELASKYKESEQRKRALKTLYSTFTRATQRFSDQRQQHDSHVLLIHFLDKLRVEERNARKTPSAGPDTQKMLTAVDRIFGGQFITVYTCHFCEEPYAIREPFLDISIPLCTLSVDEKKPEGSKTKPTRPTPSENLANAPNSSTSLMGKFTNYLLNISGISYAQSQQISNKEVRNYAENPSAYEASNNYCTSPAVDGSSSADASKTNVIKTMLKTLTTVESSAESEVRIPQSRKVRDFNNKTPSPRVSQCLEYFTRAEVIDSEYLCRNCQRAGSDELRISSATKRTLISSPPATLVLHLKRFEQKSTGFVKRDEMISYDELLDLGPFCSFSAQRIDPEEENVWYSLYAVVVHSGFSLSHGTYIAYVKQRDSSAQIDDQLREKFLQKNSVEREKVPNDDDLAAMEKRKANKRREKAKRKANKRREKAKRPHPLPGQWFRIKDDSVRSCDAEKALDQKAFLLFYERIPGTDHKFT